MRLSGALAFTSVSAYRPIRRRWKPASPASIKLIKPSPTAPIVGMVNGTSLSMAEALTVCGPLAAAPCGKVPKAIVKARVLPTVVSLNVGTTIVTLPGHDAIDAGPTGAGPSGALTPVIVYGINTGPARVPVQVMVNVTGLPSVAEVPITDTPTSLSTIVPVAAAGEPTEYGGVAAALATTVTTTDTLPSTTVLSTPVTVQVAVLDAAVNVTVAAQVVV